MNASWPALLEWYTASPGKGGTSSPVTDVIFRIVPVLVGIMARFKTLCVTNMMPLTFVLFMVWMCSTERSWKAEGAPRARPAYLGISSSRFSHVVFGTKITDIVHKNIDLTKRLHHVGNGLIDSSIVTDVHRRVHVLTPSPGLLELLLQGSELVLYRSASARNFRSASLKGLRRTSDREKSAKNAPFPARAKAMASPIPMDAPV